MSSYNYVLNKNPEFVAKSLKTQLNINENNAIDLFNILKQLNIRIIYKEIKRGVLGACKAEGLKKLIVINPNINNIGRERFTISHEIGHMLLHHGSFYCNNEDLNLWKISNDRELQANAFASELLLPKIPLVQILKRKNITIGLIGSISKKYETSLISTAIRLIKLSDEQIALFYHHDEKILWCVKSPECRYDIQRYAVSPISISYKANKTNQIISGYVDATAWYINVPDSYNCLEETIYFSKLHGRLTIAMLEEEEW